MNIPADDSEIDMIITSKKLTDLVSQFEIFDQVLLLICLRKKF